MLSLYSQTVTFCCYKVLESDVWCWYDGDGDDTNDDREKLIQFIFPFQKGTCQQVICEGSDPGSSKSLNCPSSKVISVQTANYGRTKKVICGTNQNTNCLFDATAKLKSECDGKSSCAISSSMNALFGTDPCGGVGKYLDAAYKCV